MNAVPPALILIDIQAGFDDPVWGARNNHDAEGNAARLLDRWRARQQLVCHVQHVSTEPGSPLGQGTTGVEFKPEVRPIDGEAIFQKSVNSAFIGTDLLAYLKQHACTRLIICGLTTPHCVSTTTRMAANLGFDVTLAHDACAAFAANADTSWRKGLAPLTPQEVHETAVSHLHGEFATARRAAAILDEMA